MVLPENGDPTITECVNCGLGFEDAQKIGDWIKCDDEKGGCGFHFRLIARAGKLEKDE